MNKFRLSSRLFSYAFWDGVLGYTDPNDGKREKLFQEILQLEKLRKKAEYNTGSISNSAAWCLYCIINYFETKNIMEIGTFIGKSSWSMAKAQDDLYLENGYLVTCDLSNDIIIPWIGKTKFKQYKKKSSTDMLKNETINPDLVLLDGRIHKDDLINFEKLISKNTIVLLDDFEGIEKGTVNYMILKKLEKLKTHFLIYPCERSTLQKVGNFSHSTLAVMLPSHLIELVAQG
jgi:predicted O-methyltransferase YrrM